MVENPICRAGAFAWAAIGFGSGDPMRIPLTAWYFRASFDLKALSKRFPHSATTVDDAMLVRLDEQRQACITAFGVVVFWANDRDLSDLITSAIRSEYPGARPVEEVEDRLVVETDKGETRVLFDAVWLPDKPDPAQVRIISQMLARSVALEFLELEVDKALDQFEGYLVQLRQRGQLRLSTKNIIKSIGFAMETRHAVLSHLSLLDKPEATWEVEALERLFRKLYEFFELNERVSSIGRKLDFLSDNTSLLFEFLSTRKSLRLEWVIVLLIALEIVIFVYDVMR